MAIRTIAVIGAGLLGRRIAAEAVAAGYSTILEDISRERLEEAINWIRDGQPKPRTGTAEASAFGAQQCCATPTELSADPGGIITTSALQEAVREADLIIETAPEEMEIKIELFTIFDKFAKPGAILASATPALWVAEMAAVTFCQERCIGMEFFREQGGANRIDLVASAETSESTIAACGEVARRMGKEPVLVREAAVKDASLPRLKSAAQM